MILSVKNCSKHFKAVRAVEDISFEIAKGEVVGLLGPNGAGKTTTMRLITGYLKPNGGEITVNGISVLENPLEASKQVGYLPENAPLYHDMEVTDFLTYAALLRNIRKTEIPAHLKEAVALCGLQEVVGRPIGELSRGFKQRVCLAQALIHKPPLLILDEPTTGLDPHQIQEIRSLIKDIGKERTVILSTHIMQEVQAVCSRALIIAKGKLVGEGTLDQLLQKREGSNRYTAKIKASKEAIQKELPQLGPFSLEKIESANGVWQTVVICLDTAEDKSETIFQWVVANRWSLAELKRQTTSLEEIFLELTK